MLNEQKLSPWNLVGKTAVVTGGTKGIGKAIVEELASLGASVYMCGRSEEGVRRAVEAWKEKAMGAGHVEGTACDVSSGESRKRFMAKVSGYFGGKLDILVNNAGILKLSSTQDVVEEEFAAQFQTNFESSFHLSQMAYPLMKANGGGSIVFVSSIGGFLSFHPQASVYCATKGAVNQLTKSLACEWARDHIRVNAVTPGYIRTPMLGIDEQVGLPRETEAEFAGRIPMRRIGEAKEVAPAVAFLCMPFSSYTTGANLFIDGGITAHCSIRPY